MADVSFTVTSSNWYAGNSLLCVLGDNISLNYSREGSGVANLRVYAYRETSIPGLTFTEADGDVSGFGYYTGTATETGLYKITQCEWGLREVQIVDGMTLELKIGVNVTFNQNGGSNDTTTWKFIHYESGNGTYLPDPGTKSGHVFLGWSIDGSTIIGGAGDWCTFDFVPTENYEVTALWTSNVYKHTIRYVGNGGTWSGGATEYVQTEQSASSYLDMTVGHGPTYSPSPGDYTFKGWGTYSGDSTPNYSYGDTIRVSAGSTTTLYAIWERTYDYYLMFYSGKESGVTNLPGTVSEESSTNTNGVYLTIPSLIPYSSYESLFLGWAEDENAQDPQYQPGSSVWVSASLDNYAPTVKLYAIWRKNTRYRIYYESDITSTGMPSDWYDSNTLGYFTFTVASEKPVATDYVFSRWNTAQDGSGTDYNAGDQITVYAENKDTTIQDFYLYAMWEREYILTYNLNGGYISNESDTADIITKYRSSDNSIPSITITNLFPTKDGTNLIFIGWSKSPDATAAEYASGDPYVWDTAQGEFANTLYAVYVVGFRYTVIYDVDGDTSQIAGYDQILAENTKEYIVTNATPVKEGAAFIGWGRSKSETNLYQPGDSIQLTPDQPLTLYAYWSYSNELIDEPTSIQGSYDPETGRGQCFIDITYSRGTVQARENHTKLFMPIINGINHSYNASLTEIPTVIYGSDNTFVTDLGVTERISVSVSRVNPVVIDDVGGMVSGQIHKLSNKRWWHILKTALDYWQNFGHRIYGDRRVRTGGFRFFYQPYCTDLYPTIDKNVFLSGTLAPTFTPQKLSFDLNMVVSRMAQETKEQEMATIIFRYVYNGKAEEDVYTVALGAYFSIPSLTLADGKVRVLNWKLGDYAYTPGSTVQVLPTDGGSDVIKVTESENGFSATLTGTLAEISPVIQLLHCQSLATMDPVSKYVIADDYKNTVTYTQSGNFNGKFTISTPFNMLVNFTIIGAGGGGGAAPMLGYGGGGGGSGCSRYIDISYAAVSEINYSLGKGGTAGDPTNYVSQTCIGPGGDGELTQITFGLDKYEAAGGKGAANVLSNKVFSGGPATKDEFGPVVEVGKDDEGNPITEKKSTSGAGGKGGSYVYPTVTHAEDGKAGYGYNPMDTYVGIGGTTGHDGTVLTNWSGGGGGGGATSFTGLGLTGSSLGGLIKYDLTSVGGDGFELTNGEYTEAYSGVNGGGGGGGGLIYPSETISAGSGGHGAIEMIIYSYKVIS